MFKDKLMPIMNKELSLKVLIRLLLFVSLIYAILQTLIFFNDDKKLSEYFRLEKNKNELVDQDHNQKPYLWPVIKAISDNHFWILRAGVLITAFLAFYYKDKNKDLFNLFINITISVIVILILASGVVTWIFKILIGKPRPNANIETYLPFNLSTKYHSFPSGHTTETFSYIIPYIYFIRKPFVVIILSIYGILAVFTRVVLSYHFITDVLSGIYITVLLGCIVCYIVENKSRQSYKKIV